MVESLYVIGDIGASRTRIAVYSEQGEWRYNNESPTLIDDYVAAVTQIGDVATSLSSRRAKVVSAAVAVAAEVNADGFLTKSGALTPWVGQSLEDDLEVVLGLSHGRVSTPNDMVAVAISQQHDNKRNGRPARGIANTLSSGWGAALYFRESRPVADEPGHEHLRHGGICPCGVEGHAEAFISGGGIQRNHDMRMADWLATVEGAPRRLVRDISMATIQMIERHAKNSDFMPDEVRWTGGVALNQPFVMQAVAEKVITHYKRQKIALAFDLVSMGEAAGLHGALLEAQRLAKRY